MRTSLQLIHESLALSASPLIQASGLGLALRVLKSDDFSKPILHSVNNVYSVMGIETYPEVLIFKISPVLKAFNGLCLNLCMISFSISPLVLPVAER